MREAPENQTGVTKSEDYRVGPVRSKGQRDPVASHTPPSMRPVSPGGKGEKIQQVLERVYDSRRLRQAWEQIKNAGAAGIDGMTIQTWVKMKRWRSVFRREVLILCDLAWFRRQGLIFLDDYTNRNLELKFSC